MSTLSTPSLEKKINDLQERLSRPNIPSPRPGGDSLGGGRPTRPTRCKLRDNLVLEGGFYSVLSPLLLSSTSHLMLN